MLKLGAPESGWKDLLPGVRVRFLPISRKMVRAARSACRQALQNAPNDIIEASDELTAAMLRLGIAEWAGIGDQNEQLLGPADLVPVIGDDGNPAKDHDGEPVMQAAVELFIANTDCFEAAERIYVQPWLDRDREKNGSAASSNGTSTEATPALGTANSPAPQAKASGAKSARTGKTSPRPKKANSSSK